MAQTNEKVVVPDEAPPSGHMWITLVAVAFSLFQLYTAGFGVLPNIMQRSIHLGFVLVLCYALYRVSKKGPAERIPWYDWVIIAVIVAITAYTVLGYDHIIMSMGSSTLIDRVVALAWLLLIAEGSRRLLGWFFPCLLAVFVSYAFIPNLPGMFMHSGFSFKQVMEQLYMGTVGYWGTVTATSATVIATYIIFGSLLLGTGGGQTFMEIAQIVAGRAQGGAGKIAVIASGLFGTINGTVTANVATVGSFTIPTMKRLGYAPEVAGAVEATASTGGQIMPPIMGAGAFIMAELIGIPYIKIAAAAAIPAILYYAACFAGIHYEAGLRGYVGMRAEELPRIRDVIAPRKILPVILPIVLLIYMLIVGYTPVAAAFWSIILMLALHAIFLRSWDEVKEFGRKVWLSLEDGGKGIILVGALVAVSQIVSCIVGLTGLGIRFSELLMAVSGGQVFLALLMAMLITLVLGMGVPTVAAYVLGAAVIGPALIYVGVDALPAHLFIFYFAAISAITPPVCAGVYVAAGIARSDWFRTAIQAMKFGVAGFIVPYVFVYQQSLLLRGTPEEIVWKTIVTAVATVFLSAAIIGYMHRPLSWVKRGAMVIGAIMTIWPSGYVVDITGLIILAVILVTELVGMRRHAPEDDGVSSEA